MEDVSRVDVVKGMAELIEATCDEIDIPNVWQRKVGRSLFQGRFGAGPHLVSPPPNVLRKCATLSVLKDQSTVVSHPYFTHEFYNGEVSTDGEATTFPPQLAPVRPRQR
jgi:hypothetical protein